MDAARITNRGDLSHEEWVALRRTGIGGSDAAAVMGASTHKTPLGVYMEKKGADMFEGNNVTRMGEVLEDMVADLFSEASGIKVRKCNFVLQSKAYPFMQANLDRVLVGRQAGLECKTTTSRNPCKFAEGEIPREYYWQCQHYMVVTGWEVWYLAVLLRDTGEFFWFELKREEEHVHALIRAEEIFWTEHVMADNPPQPTGGKADEEAVMLLAGEESDPDAEEVNLDDMYLMLTNRKELVGLIDQLTAQKEAIDQQIKMRMGSAERAVCSGTWQIRHKTSETTRLDTKRLREEQPDLSSAYALKTTQRRFTVKEVL